MICTMNTHEYVEVGVACRNRITWPQGPQGRSERAWLGEATGGRTCAPRTALLRAHACGLTWPNSANSPAFNPRPTGQRHAWRTRAALISHAAARIERLGGCGCLAPCTRGVRARGVRAARRLHGTTRTHASTHPHAHTRTKASSPIGSRAPPSAVLPWGDSGHPSGMVEGALDSSGRATRTPPAATHGSARRVAGRTHCSRAWRAWRALRARAARCSVGCCLWRSPGRPQRAHGLAPQRAWGCHGCAAGPSASHAAQPYRLHTRAGSSPPQHWPRTLHAKAGVRQAAAPQSLVVAHP